MELREVLLILHIAAAGTWLGANVVQFAVARSVRSQSSEVSAAWARTAAGLGTTVYMPAGIVLVLTGVVLVLNSAVYTFGTRFVTVGLSVVIVGAILGPAVFAPGGHKVAEALEAGDRAAATRGEGRIARFAALDTLLVLFAIVVMVLRWS